MRDASACLGLAIATAASLACSASTTAQSPDKARTTAAATASAGAPAAVMAEGQGVTITLADVEQRLGPDRLMDLRQREYDLRREALDSLLEELLVEKEAQAQGLSVEKLKEREVDQKTAKPDQAEIDKLYAQNQRRLAGLPKDQASLTVERALFSRNRGMRAAAFRRELIKKHRVLVRLDAPRYEVKTPADAPSLGPSDARVTIIAFADYQCPFCHQAQLAVEEILKRYSGKIRLVHRDFPLDSIHPRATPAARASRCAGEQGKFWEYHRGLLAATSDLSDADLKNRAQALGLNLTSFSSCLAERGGESAVQQSLAEGNKLGVSATPTFFINGRRLVGAKDVPELVDVIEDELARSAR